MPVVLAMQLVSSPSGTSLLDPVELYPAGYLPDLTDEDMFAPADERDPAWLAWLRSMVPLSDAKGQSMICLDYGFDPDDPPVVHIDGELDYAVIANPYRSVSYLASDFLAFLELDVTTEEDQGYDYTATSSDERMLAWARHRDSIIGQPAAPMRPVWRPTPP